MQGIVAGAFLPPHDKRDIEYATKLVDKEAVAIEEIVRRNGEELLAVAADTGVSSGVIVVTDSRTFQIKRGKVRKELAHYEVAVTRLATTQRGTTLVMVESHSSRLDYKPNDTRRFEKIVQAEVATPRIANAVCMHIDAHIAG